MPNARGNGADDVLLSRSWALSTVDDDLRALSGRLDERHSPPDARAVETPELRWAEVLRRQDRLHDWMSADALRRGELAQVDAVLRAPRFADPCPTRLTGQCEVSELLNLADFVAVADLEVALRGDWSQAIARAVDLLLAADELIPTARGILVNVVALSFALRAVDHVRVLLVGYRAATESGAANAELTLLRPTLEGYLAMLDAPDALARDELRSRRAVIAECHAARQFLMLALADPATNPNLPGGFLAAYLVDPPATVAASDREYVALMLWVEARDHLTRPPPPNDVYASGPAWWVWNPGGKQILDTVGIEHPAVIRGMDRMSDDLFASRAALRRELGALLE